MRKQIREQVPGKNEVHGSGEKMIIEAVDSFFQQAPVEIIEYLESVLFDWYQHYASEHYTTDRINEVVKNTFRVNDLLLKLNEAMIIMKEEQGLDANHLQLDDSGFRRAS